MKLRATFVIELEARDFLSAAEHQRRLESYLDPMRDEFGAVSFSFRERRASSTDRVSSKPKRVIRTGNLNDYEDE